MKPPPDFQFSQRSLQDFVDCRRRFYLHYLLRLDWPAVQSEPALEREREIQKGLDFHRMAQQALIGIPVERLAEMVQQADLTRWWENFIEFLPSISSGVKDKEYESGWNLHPELSLSTPLAGFRLRAKYDLVTAHPQGRLVIYDWKTTRQRTKRQILEKRLQTRVYPYLLTRAGAAINRGQPVQPEQVEMVYWFAEHPDQPERFSYSSAAFKADELYLTTLIETIQRLEEAEFTLTDDVRRCAYCVYRSLCNRGITAGELGEDLEEETLPEAGFDFEQIAEIEY